MKGIYKIYMETYYFCSQIIKCIYFKRFSMEIAFMTGKSCSLKCRLLNKNHIRISSIELLVKTVLGVPQTIQAFEIPLGCLPDVDDKTVVLEILCILTT